MTNSITDAFNSKQFGRTQDDAVSAKSPSTSALTPLFAKNDSSLFGRHDSSMDESRQVSSLEVLESSLLRPTI